MTHAQKRLKERYDIHPSKGLMKKIKQWILNDSPRVRFVRMSYWGRFIYSVRIGKKYIPVVYDQGRRGEGKIITFLPQEAI